MVARCHESAQMFPTAIPELSGRFEWSWEAVMVVLFGLVRFVVYVSRMGQGLLFFLPVGDVKSWFMHAQAQAKV